MVYASDTLFIASGSTIHSIPSQFTSVPSDRSLFVGQQQVTDICLNDPSIAIEDMTVTSRGAQPLPRESDNYSRSVHLLCRMESLAHHRNHTIPNYSIPLFFPTIHVRMLYGYLNILSLFIANLQALERGVARVTPQAAPSPPSEGPGSTITSVVLQWTAPPPVLPNSPLTFILNYLLNGANPVRNVILKVTNLCHIYTI